MSKIHIRNKHGSRNDLGGEYKWGDTGQIILFIVFIMGFIIDLFFLKISFYWQDVFPWYYRILVFLPLLFIAWYFIQQSHNKIFKEERKYLIVIKTDIYAIIRHPMYFGSILIYIDFVILSFSVIAFVISIVIFFFYIYLCLHEEKLLIKKLGSEYCEYIKKVPMLIPFTKIKKD